MPLGSAPPGRKGFYVSAPLLGTIIFLIAAVLAVLMAVENETMIRTATSSAGQDKLQFIASAIMADSYNVLLQHNLENLTGDFLDNEYNEVSTGEGDWKLGLRNKLVKYYSDSLGEALGVDVGAYAEAYSQMPTVSACTVVTVEGAYSDPSATDSPDGDGTLVVRGHSTGERINCSSREPDATIIVDITDRYYRVNVRLPDLYSLAKQVLGAAKGAMNSGSEGIDEPIAKWEGPRWAVVKISDNTLTSDERFSKTADFDLGAGLAAEWKNWMEYVSKQIRFIEEGKILSSGMVGMKIDEFNISEETGGEYELKDFEVSCIPQDAEGSAEKRGCMPFKTTAYLGRGCATSEGEPIDGVESFYYIKELKASCGGSSCKPEVERILKEMAAPAGKVCIGFYDGLDPVLPVCKEWQAKAKAALMKGALKDDNPKYVLEGRDMTVFKFQDMQYNIDSARVKDARLKCNEGGADEASYKANVKSLMASLKLKIGAVKVSATSERWGDKNTPIVEPVDGNLKSMYESVFEKGGTPAVCYYGGVSDGVTTKPGCSQDSRKPSINLNFDWSEARGACRSKVDELCNALCGGGAESTHSETFCKGMFPEGGYSGGKGMIKCTGCGKETEIRVDWMTLEH